MHVSILLAVKRISVSLWLCEIVVWICLLLTEALSHRGRDSGPGIALLLAVEIFAGRLDVGWAVRTVASAKTANS